MVSVGTLFLAALGATFAHPHFHRSYAQLEHFHFQMLSHAHPAPEECFALLRMSTLWYVLLGPIPLDLFQAALPAVLGTCAIQLLALHAL